MAPINIDSINIDSERESLIDGPEFWAIVALVCLDLDELPAAA